MKINRDNYEQYFLDHTEGSLSQEMERELALFLEANADLKLVLEGFDTSPIPSSEIKNDDLRNRLKKNIHPTLHIDEAHVDEWLIREAEGLLSEAETLELNEFITLNPAFEYDRKLTGLARMEPDLSIIFPGKSLLKKKGAIIPVKRLVWVIPAAAALILIFIGIKILNNPESANNQNVIQQTVQPVAKVQAPVFSEPIKKAEMKEKGTPAQRDSSPEGLQPRGTPAPVPPLPVTSRSSTFRMEPSIPLALVSSFWHETTTSSMITYKYSEQEVLNQKDKSLLAKVFGNMAGNALNALRSKSGVEKVREADLNIWSIAEAGVKGFNTVSDRDLELMVRRDQEGRIKSFALVEQDHLLLSRNRDNN
jgi:hypothetical protein